MFTKHEQADAFTVEVTVRNFKPVAPFVVRWQRPLMRPDESLDPARLKLAGGRPKRHTVEALLRLLGDQSLGTAEWQKLAQTESGMPKSTFYSLLAEVRKLEVAIQSNVNSRWQRVCSDRSGKSGQSGQSEN